jgi:hypothetical protein
MPNNKPWLDDYEAKKKAEINAENARVLLVQKIQNEAMKISNACPNKVRTPETCVNCKEGLKEQCIKSWKKQKKYLWPEMKTEPGKVAFPVSTPGIFSNTPNLGRNVNLDRKEDRTLKAPSLLAFGS